MDKYWYWITNIEGVGKVSVAKLLEKYISPKTLFFQDDAQIRHELNELKISEKGITNYYIAKDKLDYNYDKLLRRNEQLNIKMVCIEDKNYPSKLKNIYPIPYVLYYRGRLPDEKLPILSIIGSRRCDEYGKKLSYTIAKNLALNGIQIISGMAMGIDKYSHEGAIVSGQTFAILGCGVDICYPQTNIDTYLRIIENGGIISEYPTGSVALKHHFPERNRIISGLSDGILVVQAKKKSGSLITVEHALEQGKNVYSIPGRITDELSEGCLDIIKEGAKCVTCVDDILEDFDVIFNIEKYTKNHFLNNANKKLIENSLETVEKIVYASLRLETRYIDELKNELGFSLPVLMTALVSLELKGLVKKTNGNRYSLDVSNIY